MNNFLKNSFIIIVVLLFFYTSESVIAQQSEDSCETVSLKLDIIRNEFNRKDSKQYLILLARLGKEEQNAALNIRRLYAVRKYLITIGVQAERIITAQANRSDNVGKVEIYIEGQFVEAVFSKKNLDIPVGNCDNEKEDKKNFQLKKSSWRRKSSQ